MTGLISSLQSLGTVDGPGVRTVVFGAGCPLRCAYCHNPETWSERGEEYTAEALARKIMRFKPYIKNGGVTFSGGEPLVQAEFFAELAELLKKERLHLALDTSGSVRGDAVDRLLGLVDLVLLDVKFTTESDYARYAGGSLAHTLEFFDKLKLLRKRVWVRQVIVGGLTDSDDDAGRLAELLGPYREIIDRVELLPFRKLCLEKYERLGLTFPLAGTDETDEATIVRLTEAFERRYHEYGR